jgi:hypothetical protein
MDDMKIIIEQVRTREEVQEEMDRTTDPVRLAQLRDEMTLIEIPQAKPF